MQITLSGNQVDIGERLRSHVEENVLNSVNKYFPAPISCSVNFSKVKDEFIAEVTVHPAKNIVLKGTGQAGDPYSAFDSANEHIATRLRRHKTKLNDHKGKAGLTEVAYEAVFPFDEEAEVEVAQRLCAAHLSGAGYALCHSHHRTSGLRRYHHEETEFKLH